MMALSAVLDGMILARSVVENTSIVQNFQSVVEGLNYCAGGQAHRMSLDVGLTGRTIRLQLGLH
jgi:hypothetical protein